jgi:uncharacterized protein (TIGR03118 family)
MRSISQRRRSPGRAVRLAVAALEDRVVPRATLFDVTELVANQGGTSVLEDTNLVNPWGIALNPTGAFWVANNGTNTATLYTGDFDGDPLEINSLIVDLPGGAPTGQIFNDTDDFLVTDGTTTGKAAFLFSTEDGEIVGWSPTVPAPAPSTVGQIAATVPGAFFTGLAIAESGGENYIYAADFRNGDIVVFNSDFEVVTLDGDFTDPNLPSGYAPFNIIAFNDKLYVAYAVQNATGDAPVPGVSRGIIDVFNTDGTFDQRLVQHGLLNAPWGMAIAPASFGSFGGELLVANTGNGQIHTYDPETGHFEGTLRDSHGQKLKIDGLRGLAFGNGVASGDADALYFTAGDEASGTFGSIRDSNAPPPLAVDAVGADETGGPHVKMFDQATGQVKFSFIAYDPAFRGGVRVAVGDVTGDGVLDLVTAPGRSGGPHVKIFDGVDGRLIREFMAFDLAFTGGVNLAVGDVDGDGQDDVITGADAGGGPHVKVFSGADNAVLQSFMAYDMAFNGGVRVAAGDINFDGLADVITGAGVGGGPHVKAFDAVSQALLKNFIAFSSVFRGGIFVAAGDVNDDGSAEIVVGAGNGMNPKVAIYNPVLNAIQQNFSAYADTFLGGVRVAVRDADHDGRADIITGAGAGGGPHVRVIDAATQNSINELLAFDGNFLGGVFVG